MILCVVLKRVGERRHAMDLGYGFIKGTNRVSKQKVKYWRHKDGYINWHAFLWYMAQYITIIDYDNYGFDVEIMSKEQREFFYRKVIGYKETIGEVNYAINKGNDLYMKNDKYKRNRGIIERLRKE